jgi:hypothetical protein
VWGVVDVLEPEDTFYALIYETFLQTGRIGVPFCFWYRTNVFVKNYSFATNAQKKYVLVLFLFLVLYKLFKNNYSLATSGQKNTKTAGRA